MAHQDGPDWQVRLWDPFVSRETGAGGVEVLTGHEAKVVGLVVLDRYDTLVSIAGDKAIRVAAARAFSASACDSPRTCQPRPPTRAFSPY